MITLLCNSCNCAKCRECEDLILSSSWTNVHDHEETLALTYVSTTHTPTSGQLAATSTVGNTRSWSNTHTYTWSAGCHEHSRQHHVMVQHTHTYTWSAGCHEHSRQYQVTVQHTHLHLACGTELTGFFKLGQLDRT